MDPFPPASRRRAGARAGPDTDEEEGPLLSTDSHSRPPKDPLPRRTAPPAHAPSPPHARLSLCCKTLLVALAGAVGYLALFCAFWVRHTKSPRSNPALGLDFRSACPQGECPHLLFGLATAPAHVEDRLNDSWLDLAQQDRAGKPRVVAWKNVPIPEQRLRFWTEPEREIGLAADTGADILRLGIDWGRIVPREPPLESMRASATLSVVDWAAVERYKEILGAAKARGLRVMLTLFHHSFPKWGLATGGWLNASAITHFAHFAALAAEHYGAQVDYWVTFNEPQVFALSTHCWCGWPSAPPGSCPRGAAAFLCATPLGASGTALDNMARAHHLAYQEIKKRSAAPIGVAHSVAVLTPFSALDLFATAIQDRFFLFPWVDKVAPRLDFLGLNYYGQEIVSVSGLHMLATEEYSEAGRAVYPDGLYKLLLAFHRRYRVQYPQLSYMVTENGIADAEDTIRRVYLLEHLAALHAAIRQGVPVSAYLHWTISDNWEWADGYCPKFGLVEVQRDLNLSRRPRPSFHLYTQVVKSRAVTVEQRAEHWRSLQEKAEAGAERPVCRIPEPSGLMAPDSLDSPARRKFATRDWRFGMYRHAGFLTMLARSFHVIGTLFGGIKAGV